MSAETPDGGTIDMSFDLPEPKRVRFTETGDNRVGWRNSTQYPGVKYDDHPEFDRPAIEFTGSANELHYPPGMFRRDGEGNLRAYVTDGKGGTKLTPPIGPGLFSGTKSVRNYGAKGDGETDDTQAFIDAISDQCLVYVPAGTYLISQSIKIRDCTSFYGDSADLCVIKLADDFDPSETKVFYEEQPADLAGSRSYDHVFQNLTFDGNDFVDPTFLDVGAGFVRAFSCRFVRCGAVGIGLNSDFGYYADIKDCLFVAETNSDASLVSMSTGHGSQSDITTITCSQNLARKPATNSNSNTYDIFLDQAGNGDTTSRSIILKDNVAQNEASTGTVRVFGRSPSTVPPNERIFYMGNFATGDAAEASINAEASTFKRLPDQQIIDVRLFGASGNGTDDDGPAIQAAMDAGSYVFFPAGRYRTFQSLRVRQSGKTIFGEGPGSSFIVRDPSLGKECLGYDKDVEGTINDLTVRDLGFDGDGSTNGGDFFFCSGGASESLAFYRCQFFDSPSNSTNSVLPKGVYDFTVADCTFRSANGNLSHAIYMRRCKNIKIVNNRFINCRSQNVRSEDGNVAIVSGNFFFNDGNDESGRPINWVSTSNAVICDNVFTGTFKGTSTIRCAGSDRVVISGNSLICCENEAIVASSGSGISIVGNTMRDARSKPNRAILMDNIVFGLVSNNLLDFANQSGDTAQNPFLFVVVKQNSERVAVKNNLFRGRGDVGSYQGVSVSADSNRGVVYANEIDVIGGTASIQNSDLPGYGRFGQIRVGYPGAVSNTSGSGSVAGDWRVEGTSDLQDVSVKQYVNVGNPVQTTSDKGDVHIAKDLRVEGFQRVVGNAEIDGHVAIGKPSQAPTDVGDLHVAKDLRVEGFQRTLGGSQVDSQSEVGNYLVVGAPGTTLTASGDVTAAGNARVEGASNLVGGLGANLNMNSNDLTNGGDVNAARVFVNDPADLTDPVELSVAGRINVSRRTATDPRGVIDGLPSAFLANVQGPLLSPLYLGGDEDTTAGGGTQVTARGDFTVEGALTGLVQTDNSANSAASDVPQFGIGSYALWAKQFNDPQPSIGTNIDNANAANQIVYSDQIANVLFDSNSLTTTNSGTETEIPGTWQCCGITTGRAGGGDFAGGGFGEDALVYLLVKIAN